MDVTMSDRGLLCPLTALPHEVQCLITGHLDLVTVARLRSSCKAFNHTVLYPEWTSHLQLITAAASGDFKLFQDTLLRASIAQHDGSDLRDLDHVRRRRQLLEVCIWHLVANRNQGGRAWWALLDLLFDRTKVYDKDTENEADDEQSVKEPNEARRKLLDTIERGSEAFLERMLVVAMDRRHSAGVMAMSEFCQRNKAWINSLDLWRQGSDYVKTNNVATDSVAIDMLAALVHLIWFGTDWDDERSETACELLAQSGHLLVILEGIIALSPLASGSYDIMTHFSELMSAVWDKGHHQLALQLLDLFLLANGSAMCDPNTFPRITSLMSETNRILSPKKAKCRISFPVSTHEMHDRLVRQFACAGISPDKFHLVLLCMRSWDWYDAVRWFSLCPNAWSLIDQQLVVWYLLRAPIDLELVHAFCHDLPARFRQSRSLQKAPGILSEVLDLVPFDPLPAHALPAGQSTCARCAQLRALSKGPNASRQLKAFVGEEPQGWDVFTDPQPAPMQFAAVDPARRREQAAKVRDLLASIPPPDVPLPSAASEAANPSVSLPVAADNKTQADVPRTKWRAYFSSFSCGPGYSYSVTLKDFWPHVRDANALSAVNVIPFDDFMWSMLHHQRFDEALPVLKEARTLDRFRSWQLTRDEWVDAGAEQVCASSPCAADRTAFLEYLFEHGLAVHG